MNYIKQLNEFYKNITADPLSPNAKNMYETLLHISSDSYWRQEITVANTYLILLTGLNKQKLDRARNELIQRGFITFKKGINQNQAGKYCCIKLYSENDTTLNTPNDIPNDTAGNTAHDTAPDTINKQNKTKQKNKEKDKKKNYGENGNVKFTDEEFEKVKAYFPNDYMDRIQSLDDYIQSTGKKYKDFFATLKTWARKDGYKPPSLNEPKKEEFIEIDTSQLTDEEYDMLVKKKITVQELIEKGRINV